MILRELISAYKAIHTLRTIADESSDSITLSSFPCGDRNFVNPIEMLHRAIQERLTEFVKKHGLQSPFVVDGQIVYWDYTRQKLAFIEVDAAEISSNLSV